MEQIHVTVSDGKVQIEGYPNAVKPLALSGVKAKHAADLALHDFDLRFAQWCLTASTEPPREQPGDLLGEAPWRSALVHLFKCFQFSEARERLEPENVYAGIPLALEAFKHLKALRDKHVVHDQNPYMQCHPIAVLNRDGMDRKVARVICMPVMAVRNADDVRNLRLLIADARAWVTSQFDRVCDEIAAELEARPYAELLTQPGAQIPLPTADDVHLTRQQP